MYSTWSNDKNFGWRNLSKKILSQDMLAIVKYLVGNCRLKKWALLQSNIWHLFKYLIMSLQNWDSHLNINFFSYLGGKFF